MTYYLVTGAAGFIGSHLLHALNERGIDNIVAVDNLARAEKFRNLVGCEIADMGAARARLEGELNIAADIQQASLDRQRGGCAHFFNGAIAGACIDGGDQAEVVKGHYCPTVIRSRMRSNEAGPIPETLMMSSVVAKGPFCVR